MITPPTSQPDLFDPIECVPYNKAWPKLAQLEITILRATLPTEHIIDIQHIGSTAIPGIQSKPIIDILVAVDSLANIKQDAIDRLPTLDYIFWADNPDPERIFFVKGMPPYGTKRTHHVHIVEHTSKHWLDKIQFRDYLRMNKAVAQEYERIKIDLMKRYTYDREQYTAAKTPFIKNILFTISHSHSS